MLDLRWIRENPDAFDRGLARRGLAPQADAILALDREWRAAQTRAEQLQAERNRLAKEIGAAKAKGGDAAELLRRVAESKDEEGRLEAEAARLRAAIDAALAPVPNLPADDVPDGADETAQPCWCAQHGAPPQLRVSAEGPRRPRRGARHDGFRPRRQALGRALRRAEPASSRGSSARWRNSCSISTRASSAIPRCRRRFWCATRPRSAPASCRNSPTICSAPPTGLWLIPTAEVPLTNLVADAIARGGGAAAALHRLRRRASAPRPAPPARTRAA